MAFYIGAFAIYTGTGDLLLRAQGERFRRLGLAVKVSGAWASGLLGTAVGINSLKAFAPIVVLATIAGVLFFVFVAGIYVAQCMGFITTPE